MSNIYQTTGSYRSLSDLLLTDDGESPFDYGLTEMESLEDVESLLTTCPVHDRIYFGQDCPDCTDAITEIITQTQRAQDALDAYLEEAFATARYIQHKQRRGAKESLYFVTE